MISEAHLVEASLQVESYTPTFSSADSPTYITDDLDDPNLCYVSTPNYPKVFNPFVNLTLAQRAHVHQMEVLLRYNSNDIHSKH